MKTSSFIATFVFLTLLVPKTFQAQTLMDLTILDDQIQKSELKPEVINSFGKGRRKNASYAKKEE